jgi:hypothetical protein
MRRAGPEQNRIAIRGGACDELRTDLSRCTGLVVDDDFPACRLAELLRDETHDEIGGAARRERIDDGDRLGGISLRKYRWRSRDHA